MVPVNPSARSLNEEALRLELAAATSRIAKRHAHKGAFIDVELDLWDARQSALHYGASADLLDLTATLRSAG